jgi:hypothetical protein
VTTEENKSAGIESVNLHVELDKQPVEGDLRFKVTWTVLDKNGPSSDIFVINSFSLKPGVETAVAQSSSIRSSSR